ncbi:class I SAM-dependent methyltransferase [Patescibacteria group bacterium]|nr:class I SAM-dependent methyltransferase [Patescibacteria group bacterium]
MNSKRLEELKKIVLDSYELTASHFSSTRSKVAALDFIWATEQVKETDFVLDAGCGNGRLLDYVKLPDNQYLGLDQSASLVKIAQELHSGYKFIQGELTNGSNYPSNKFSLIFCSSVLSHIPGKAERQKVLKNFFEASKSDGRLLISFWKIDKKYRQKRQFNLRNFFLDGRELVFPWKNSEGKQICLRYYHLFSKRDFKREIIKAGWNIEQENDDKYNFWLIASKK